MAKTSIKIMNIISIILIIVCIIILIPCVKFVKEKFTNSNNTIDNYDDLLPVSKDIFDTTLTKDISNSYMDSEIIKNTIPKVIIQINVNGDSNNTKISKNNLNKYAPDYQHITYNKNQGIRFLRKEYGENYVKLFTNFNNDGYKIDLLKYCYLYKYGGIYMDNDTELLRPLNQIYNKNYLYAVIAKDNKSIYKGTIASPSNNPIFMDLINHMFTTCENNSIILHEHIFARNFYKLLTNKIKKYPEFGLNKINEFNYVYLFEEHCEPCDTSNSCFINDFNLPVMKTIYSKCPLY